MRLDIHFHVRHRKENWQERLNSMVEAAIECSVDGVVLLDHNKHATQEWLDVARRLAGDSITFFRGVELDIRDEGRGIKDHLVVVCDREFDWDISRGVTTKDLPHLKEFLGGDSLTMLAHPFRKHPDISFDFYDFKPDAVEILSNNGPSDDVKRQEIMRMARHWGMALVAASDAHKGRHVGRHWIHLPERPTGAGHLRRMVAEGAFTRSDQIGLSRLETPEIRC
jgi:histidinol phosphatase-like PHP family hydrolase